MHAAVWIFVVIMNVCLTLSVAIRCLAAYRYRFFISDFMAEHSLESREPWIADGVIVQREAQRAKVMPDWLPAFLRLQRNSLKWLFASGMAGVAALMILA